MSEAGGIRGEIIVGAIAATAVVAAALISSWGNIFPKQEIKPPPIRTAPFYVTNERGAPWDMKFTIRGDYYFDKSSKTLKIFIKEGSIRSPETNFLTRLSVSTCHESGDAFETYPSTEEESPSQNILIGRQIKNGEVMQIRAQELSIDNIGSSILSKESWLCGFLWAEFSLEDQLVEGNVPGHDLGKKPIRLKI